MNRLSNLPPGVTEGMIPGNRPEDMEEEVAFQKVLDWIWEMPRLTASALQEIVLKWCKETGNEPEENPPLQIK